LNPSLLSNPEVCHLPFSIIRTISVNLPVNALSRPGAEARSYGNAKRHSPGDCDVRNACACLWATLIAVYEIPADPAWIEEILSAFQPIRNMEMLPWWADFVVFAHERWPQLIKPRLPTWATVLLSSDCVLVLRLSKNALQFFMACMSQIGEDMIMQECGFSEALVIKIQRNGERLTGK
jgi:hypothetical protein